MAGEVRRLGPDWLQKYTAGKRNATVYEVQYDKADFVPAATVVQRLNELKDLIANLRKEHPDWTVGQHRRHILKTRPEMMQFYRTHKTFFLNITKPDLSMGQADEMYRLCYFRQLSESGQLTEEEADQLANEYVTSNHMRQMTPQQQLEYQKTGKVPDSAFDKRKLGYLFNRFKLGMKDAITGETFNPNEDGAAEQVFQPPQEPSKTSGENSESKDSAKRKRIEQKRAEKRERVLKHQQKK